MYYYVYRIDILDGSGRFYIGQRTSRKEPWEDIQYKGSGVRLRNIYRRHGGYKYVRDGEFYLKTILQECKDQNELNEAECGWIGDQYIWNPRCLNLKAGGDHAKLSKESKRKISEANRGKHYTEEARLKMSEAKKGKHYLKLKWLTPEGNVIEMCKSRAHKFHPDWIEIKNY